ncbi:MAG: imelysin family protein [Myxococcota bacterium]
MPAHSQSNSPASRGAWFLPLVLAGLGVLGWACQDSGGSNDSSDDDSGNEDGTESADGTSDGSSEVTRQDVLASIATQVIVPSTADFATQAASLQSAVDAYAAAHTDEATLQAAQDSWRETMSQWQRLELMQVGPAASSLAGIAGEDVRDEIYSWPTADTCAVDRALADEDYAADTFFVTELVWAYGLDALEYLLFAAGDEHTCPTQVQLDGPWAALSDDERASRRATYAAVLAGHIADQASTLATRWDPAGDDYAALLANPGSGDSPYASDVEALDEIFRSMFYVDKQTKDAKLGLPLGLVTGCDAVPCLDLLENPWSADAGPAIVANLSVLRDLIQGGSDPETADGFDDLLEQMGEGQIASTLLADIDSAIATIEALDAPLAQVIASDTAQGEAVHAAVKNVTDTLKGPFVMALMLTIPAEGAGDHD